MLKVVCISGNNRSGKDTFSDDFIDVLREKGCSVFRVAFADILKNSLKELYRHKFIADDGTEILFSDFKDNCYIRTVTGELFTYLIKEEILQYPYIVFNHTNVDFSVDGIISVRELIIYHGERVIKPLYGKTFFVKETIRKFLDMGFHLSNSKKVVLVITDLRFEEEESELLDMFSDYVNTEVFRVIVEKPDNPYKNPFESQISKQFTFENKFDKETEEYRDRVDAIANMIL